MYLYLAIGIDMQGALSATKDIGNTRTGILAYKGVRKGHAVAQENCV